MEEQQNIVEDVMDIAGRRKGCWRNQDCGSCLKSKYSCGWCPSVSHFLFVLINLVHFSELHDLILTQHI